MNNGMSKQRKRDLLVRAKKESGWDPLKSGGREGMRKLIVRHRGDIYRMAEDVGYNPRKVRNYLAADDELHALQLAAVKANENEEVAKGNYLQFEAYLQEYTRDLALMGLQAMEQLVTMDTMKERVPVEKQDPATGQWITEMQEQDVGLNAAAMKVKFEAARTLASIHQPSMRSGTEGGGDVIAELNRLYQEHAPRIKQIRQTTITLETNPQPMQEVSRLIEGEE